MCPGAYTVDVATPVLWKIEKEQTISNQLNAEAIDSAIANKYNNNNNFCVLHEIEFDVRGSGLYTD